MSKIVFYVNAINGGGAERVMVNLAKYFSENGYDTTLVTSFRDTWEYPLAATVRRLTLEEVEHTAIRHRKQHFAYKLPYFSCIFLVRIIPNRNQCFYRQSSCR